MTDNIKSLVERLRRAGRVAMNAPILIEAADLIERQAARIAELEAREPAASFALQALVAAGHVTQAKVDEALSIAGKTQGVADRAEKSPAPEESEADGADSARERWLPAPSRVGDQMQIANGADSEMAKDAEAFRQMVKHRLLVGVHFDESWAQSYGTPEGEWLTIKEKNGDDAGAAARRAIERAVAAIAASAGKEQKA